MEATERDRQEQEFAAQSDAENAAENVYSPSEYERIKLKPLMPAILAIGGVKQTRGYVIARELKGLNQAQNLDELKDVLLDATNALMALDIFEAVEFTLDDEPLQREGGEGQLCRVLLRVKEKPRVKLHGGVYAQGNEGVTEGSVTLSNLLGTAEKTSISAEIGSRHSSEYAVSIAQPRVWGLPLEASLAAHQQINCCQWISSYTERLRGTTFSVSGQNRRHTLQYDLAWRTLQDDTARASPSVRSQLGDSLKSALSYTFRTGAFDDPTFPLSGYGLRSSTSLGGLWPGDHICRFARQHLAGEYTFSLLPGTAFVLSAEAGGILPLNSSPTHITDRFHLGGLGHGLRGFSFKGAGPTDLRRPDPAAEESTQRDALGGDLFASVSAILRFQLPLESLQRAGLYGQAFVNGGTSALLDRGKGGAFRRCLDHLAASPRWTMGLGILWPTNIGVVELNWCKILSAQPGDRQRTGLHFGLAVRSQFL